MSIPAYQAYLAQEKGTAEYAAYLSALEAERAATDAFMASIDNRVRRIEFGQKLMIRFVTENDVIYGITESQSLEMAAKLSNLAGLIGNGSLQAALQLWVNLEVDDILTQERIDMYAQQIADFLEIDVPSREIASLTTNETVSIAELKTDRFKNLKNAGKIIWPAAAGAASAPSSTPATGLNGAASATGVPATGLNGADLATGVTAGEESHFSSETRLTHSSLVRKGKSTDLRLRASCGPARIAPGESATASPAFLEEGA
jgi:hypothetical protein